MEENAFGLEQYRSYCRAFDVPVEIRPVTARVGGIARSVPVCGIATIPVPFPELKVVYDLISISSMETDLRSRPK